MGSLFGGRLAAAGHDVTLVDRGSEHVAAITESGLRVSTSAGDEQAIRVAATTDASAVESPDLVCVFVKSIHTADAVTGALAL